MVIFGSPDDMDNYVMADGQVAFILHKAGFSPKYKDFDGTLYFVRNKKLLKFLRENNIDL